MLKNAKIYKKIQLFVPGAVSFFGIKPLYTDYKYDKIYISEWFLDNLR